MAQLYISYIFLIRHGVTKHKSIYLGVFEYTYINVIVLFFEKVHEIYKMRLLEY